MSETTPGRPPGTGRPGSGRGQEPGRASLGGRKKGAVVIRRHGLLGVRTTRPSTPWRRDGHRREKPGGLPATAGIARGRAAVRLFPVFCSFRCLLCVLVCPSGEKLNMRKFASLPPVPSFVRTEPVGVMGNVCLATAAFCLANGRLPRPAVKPRAAFPTTLSISYLASCSPASVFSGGTPPSRREAEAGACLMLCVSGKNDTASLLRRKKLLKKQPAKRTFTYLCSVKSVSPEERNENSCEDIVSPNQRKDGR